MNNSTKIKHLVEITIIVSTLLGVLLFAPAKQVEATPRSYLIQEPDQYGVACYSRSSSPHLSCVKVTDKSGVQ